MLNLKNKKNYKCGNELKTQFPINKIRISFKQMQKPSELLKIKNNNKYT